MTETATRMGKRATGITGLDEVTRGGLPSVGATLVAGQPGAGKTVLCQQILANAIHAGQGGVFVSFEESSQQIRRDASSFNWGHLLKDGDRLQIIDARPQPGMEAAGSFDIDGLLAAIGARSQSSNASWIVLDGIDRLLRLQPSAGQAVEQIATLDAWCQQHQLSLLLTAKLYTSDNEQQAYLEEIEYLLDTVLMLSTDLVGRRLNRRFRIAKYRGSSHVTDELPMVMDDNGLHVPFGEAQASATVPVSQERLGTGIQRLDKVLGGGIHRGSTTLISGLPGTSKTTLAASFACAAAARGELALYLSFDELADRIVRNVASVGIDLARHLDSGHLRIVSREAWRSLVEVHFIEVLRLLDEFKPDVLVIDPVSALLKAASAETPYVAVERLLGMARARGITSVITSLSEGDAPESESTLSHTSTLADTWISLGYDIRGGERNRSLSVVKSRGTAHSNQVRELLLTNEGIDLADVYQFGSEVLMGTARMQKESEEASLKRQRQQEQSRREHELQRELEQARSRLNNAQSEAQRLEQELEIERQATTDSQQENKQHHDHILQRRDSGKRSDGDKQ
ncbi:circadian clock protein KaiC [Methylohalomonas lacus]|uniref:non-specific serine/threonine protein kinase n=1 Tax=Methylohalomonas lacus TaxID=398773 RepID=A0AAE3HIE6_9GAMM|nr:circadian clock protein KaiC [Methylohalomonas lacus]MCS3902450.1 circadian clock protein KaiC [Methylohalomonas lacus]